MNNIGMHSINQKDQRKEVSKLDSEDKILKEKQPQAQEDKKRESKWINTKSTNKAEL